MRWTGTKFEERARAGRHRHVDPTTPDRAALVEHLRTQVDELRVRFTPRSPLVARLGRALGGTRLGRWLSRYATLSVTFGRRVATPVATGDADVVADAPVMVAHELVHVRQWGGGLGRALFALRYVASPRWRLTFELEAYAESVVALTIATGGDRVAVERYVHDVAQRIEGTYALGRVDDVEAVVTGFLLDVLDEVVDARGDG